MCEITLICEDLLLNYVDAPILDLRNLLPNPERGNDMRGMDWSERGALPRTAAMYVMCHSPTIG